MKVLEIFNKKSEIETILDELNNPEKINIEDFLIQLFSLPKNESHLIMTAILNGIKQDEIDFLFEELLKKDLIGSFFENFIFSSNKPEENFDFFMSAICKDNQWIRICHAIYSSYEKYESLKENKKDNKMLLEKGNKNTKKKSEKDLKEIKNLTPLSLTLSSNGANFFKNNQFLFFKKIIEIDKGFYDEEIEQDSFKQDDFKLKLIITNFYHCVNSKKQDSNTENELLINKLFQIKNKEEFNQYFSNEEKEKLIDLIDVNKNNTYRISTINDYVYYILAEMGLDNKKIGLKIKKNKILTYPKDLNNIYQFLLYEIFVTRQEEKISEEKTIYDYLNKWNRKEINLSYLLEDVNEEFQLKDMEKIDVKRVIEKEYLKTLTYYYNNVLNAENEELVLNGNELKAFVDEYLEEKFKYKDKYSLETLEDMKNEMKKIYLFAEKSINDVEDLKKFLEKGINIEKSFLTEKFKDNLLSYIYNEIVFFSMVNLSKMKLFSDKNEMRDKIILLALAFYKEETMKLLHNKIIVCAERMTLSDFYLFALLNNCLSLSELSLKYVMKYNYHSCKLLTFDVKKFVKDVQGEEIEKHFLKKEEKIKQLAMKHQIDLKQIRKGELLFDEKDWCETKNLELFNGIFDIPIFEILKLLKSNDYKRQQFISFISNDENIDIVKCIGKSILNFEYYKMNYVKNNDLDHVCFEDFFDVMLLLAKLKDKDMVENCLFKLFLIHEIDCDKFNKCKTIPCLFEKLVELKVIDESTLEKLSLLMLLTKRKIAKCIMNMAEDVENKHYFILKINKYIDLLQKENWKKYPNIEMRIINKKEVNLLLIEKINQYKSKNTKLENMFLKLIFENNILIK